MPKRDKLEDVYQDVAALIDRNAYKHEVLDNKHPRLVIKDTSTDKLYELTIKEVKQ